VSAPEGLLTRSIDALASGVSLSRAETAAVLAEIMEGNATEVQIAGFLIALRTKGETVEELAGLAQTMRAMSARVQPGRADLVDTAGTGGGRRTFNVSTTAALIAAPAHHSATRYVIPVRKQLAVRTIFNFLGPLTNPAGAGRQLIGVSDRDYLETMAGALARLGTKRALLVTGDDGVDELSISSTSTVVEVNGEELSRYTVSPEDVGLAVADAGDVPGGDPAANAATTRAIFAGERGAARDLAVLNAGAAVYAGGRVDNLGDGVRASEDAIDSGAATALLERFVGFTQSVPQ